MVGDTHGAEIIMPLPESLMKRYQADLADTKQDLLDYESGSAQLASRRPDGSFVDTVPQRMEDLHRTITTLEDILARNKGKA